MSAPRLVMLPPQDGTSREWAGRLAQDVPALDVVLAEDHETAMRVIATAEAAFGTPTDLQLAAAMRLRWLQAPAAAPPAGYFSEALIDHPVTVTNLRNIYNDHVATHAVAMILALARGFQRYLPSQSRGEWEPARTADAVVHLPAATVLIVGLGGIGAEIARMMRVFGCRIVATDARVTVRPDGVDEVGPPGDLDRLLPEADFVVLTVPHTPETEGLMDRDRLSLMRTGGFLVNVGRGMTVRLDDLVAALEAGTIAGAGLDVFEVEPLPPRHPLWRLPNVLLTPHVAVAGPDLDERRYAVLRQNAERFVAGKPLANVVDKAHWF